MPDTPRGGIDAYAAYLPAYVLADNRLDPHDAPAPRARRSVAAYDEDSVTMAVEAARRLPRGPAPDEQMLFATTVSPFEGKTAALVAHAALALDDSVAGLDVRGHRSGIAALGLVAGRAALAVAADVRTAKPGSADELGHGDAAAAFCGGDGEVAVIRARATRSVELLERWRQPADRHDRVWDERFTADVLVRTAHDVVGRVLAEAGIDRPDLVVVSSSNARAAAALRRALGSDNADARLEAQTGYTGAAHPGLLLADALDRAEPGQSLLLVSATDGADAILFTVGPRVREGRGGPSVATQVAARSELAYGRYLRWRGLLDVQGPARPAAPAPAAPPMHRRRDWKYGLQGLRCDACGAVTTPPGRACAACGSLEGGQTVSLRDRQVSVVSVTQDALTTLPESAVALVIGDVEGGGRLTAYATDVDPRRVAVGDHLRPTFRLMWTTEAIPNYFWKLRPWEGSTDGQ